MTFDEWFTKYNNTYGLPPAYVMAEAAWNAAIAASVAVATEVGVGSWEVWLLEALKTPLEGANDSEVVHG